MLAATIVLAVLAQPTLSVSADPKPVPVAGVVVDASDRPVAGAEVWLAAALPPDDGRWAGMELWYQTLTGLGDGALPLVVHGRSDRDGRFTLDVPAEVVALRRRRR